MSSIKQSTWRQAILSTLQLKEIQDFFYQPHLRLIRNEKEAESTLAEAKEQDETQKHNKKLHSIMWSSFSYCISQSFSNAELHAVSWERRSEFYFHLKKYDASIHDIEKSLQTTKSSDSRIKLYCRKAMCLIALGKPMDDSLIKATAELEKVENKSEKNDLKLLIDKAQEARNNCVAKNDSGTRKTDNLKRLYTKETEDISESVNIKYIKVDLLVSIIINH